MSRPGDLSANITGVGDIADDVVGFNVCLYVCPDPFLSTHVTCAQSSGLISNGHQLFSDIHHGVDLFIQFFSNNFDLIGVWCLCWIADIQRLWHIWNWKSP